MKTFALNIFPLVKDEQVIQSINLTVLETETDENGLRVKHESGIRIDTTDSKLIEFQNKINQAFLEFLNG